MRGSDKFYKDAVRHGGERARLLSIFGPKCSSCGYVGNESEIVAHHVTWNPLDHHLQILLCRSCHASLHLDGIDKKHVTKEQIEHAISETGTLDDAAKLVGLSRYVLLERRRRFGIGRKCLFCGIAHIPSQERRKYCSDECAESGKRTKKKELNASNKEKKRESDKRYYSKNREALLEKQKEYYLENTERIKAYAREWHKKRKG